MTRSKASAPSALLAVDLDGTILDADGRPHLADAEALKALSTAGVPATIVTGRAYPRMREIARSLGVLGPVACLDGGHIVNTGSDETTVFHEIPVATVDSVLSRLSRTALHVCVCGRHTVLHEPASEDFARLLLRRSERTHAIASLLGPELERCDGISAVFAFGLRDDVEHGADSIDADITVGVLPLRANRPRGLWVLVARPNEASKGAALEHLAAIYGVDMAQTVAVGDWLNDIPMLSIAGTSFAMKHATADVQSAATHVVPRTTDDGGAVAWIARKYFGVEVAQ